MPKTPTVTRSRTAAAMTSRRLDDQPTTSTDDSSATSSVSSSRGRGRGRGRGKRGRALNKKDFSQQTLYCKGCGQIGHTVLLCEEEGTSNEPALTCSDCTRTHTLNAAEKSLTTNTILCSAPADPETLRKAKFLVDRVTAADCYWCYSRELPVLARGTCWGVRTFPTDRWNRDDVNLIIFRTVSSSFMILYSSIVWIR